MQDLTYKSVDSMKLTKDPIYNQPSDADIERVCVLAAEMGANVLSIAIYLNSTADFVAKGSSQPSPRDIEDFTQKWCDEAHANGLAVCHRGTFAQVEGAAGFTKWVSGTRPSQGNSSSTDTSSICGRYYNWLQDNVACFADGDILAPIPEATGHGILSGDANSFLATPHQSNYSNLFNDLKAIGDAFATAQNLTLITGHSHHNWSEFDSGWYPNTLESGAGVVAFDHYGSEGLSSTGQERRMQNARHPALMAADLDDTYTAQGSRQLVHGEFSPFWNSTFTVGTAYMLTIEEVLHYNKQMWNVWRDRATNGKLLYWSYWGFWENTDHPTLEGIIYKDDSNVYQLRGRGKHLATWFKGNGSPRLPVTDADGNY